MTKYLELNLSQQQKIAVAFEGSLSSKKDFCFFSVAAIYEGWSAL